MLPLHEIIQRLVVATVLTGLIGLDRERHESSAGLRTHALVGMASCLFMLASAFGFHDILGTPNVSLDPSRIAAQIVTGIGFLGAGTIIATGSTVRGLTTAASIWTVAAIGLAVGGGMYWPAVVATAISLILLVVLRPWERRLDQHWRKQTVNAVFDPEICSLEQMLTCLRDANLHVCRVTVDKNEQGSGQVAQFAVDEHGEAALQTAIQAITRVQGVTSASAAE
ncbi:transporter [Edaphobacter acidisoli]|uniref:Transporter n=1 Tax=Edaphobacter acidisoli TaxID=2040573 RepID=A0A916W4Z4_9BACT|nr:MgtC/SapB family protein [Edaphobacter acidisoli]GGA65901.1 transporter [Edaphobacter acidisoli]